MIAAIVFIAGTVDAVLYRTPEILTTPGMIHADNGPRNFWRTHQDLRG